MRLLAAFAAEEGGLMGKLKHEHGITSTSWRAAVARLGQDKSNSTKMQRAADEKNNLREYLTPEETCRNTGRPCANHARLYPQ
ncbi:MAG: hypothetical protein M3Y27_31380 [Acidobacteriota bacterium]|nr:hypothetical protein [Acidobacteriota bacterium]